MVFSLLSFFTFSAALVGIVVCLIMLSSRKNIQQNFFLILCIFSLSVYSIYDFCYTSGLLNSLPYLFILTKSFTFLIAPCAYLYVRNIFYPGKVIRKLDWLHLVPFHLSLFCYLFLFKTDDRAFENVANGSKLWIVNYGNFNTDDYLFSLAKTILWFLYPCVQTFMIIKFERKKTLHNDLYNYRIINWLKVFNLLILILFGSLLIQHILNRSMVSLAVVNDTSMSLILIIAGFWLIFKPHILYGLEKPLVNQVYKNAAGRQSADPVVQSPAAPMISDCKKDEYLLILERVLADEKPFLKKGFAIRDLSTNTGIPIHHLSYLINTEFSLHFQDFVNFHRIEYLKTKINDVEWKLLSLEGMAWESGFKSRTTFFRAFVKSTGQAPSEYLHYIRNKEELSYEKDN